MTLNQLASKIAKIEGKKSQARIGDIREILSILGDLMNAEWAESRTAECVRTIWIASEKRAKRKAKEKKK